MKKIILSSLTATFLLANGYNIPEQSINGIALSAANIANASSADAAYYNPANIAFFKDKNFIELTGTFIHLNKVKFTNNNGEIYYSREEDFVVPQFHFASKEINGWRFGFCVVYPAGLSKRWDDVVPESGAKEFTLKTVELNPTIIRKFSNNFALALGIRFVRSDGVANVLGLNKNPDGTVTPLYSQYLNGTSWDKGWNIAFSFQNDKRDFKIATTFRSAVNLTISGSGSGYYSKYLLTKNPADINKYIYFNTPGKVTIPIPARLDLAMAKTFNKTTVEFVYEKTFWNIYKTLDFNFKDPKVEGIFGRPKPKYWKNVPTYRLGITHKCSDKLTAMVGFAFDHDPVPNSTIDFTLPDSNKKIYSAGIKYKLNKQMSIGIAGLYTSQKRRYASIYNPVTKRYDVGTFSEGGAYLFALGVDYSY